MCLICSLWLCAVFMWQLLVVRLTVCLPFWPMEPTCRSLTLQVCCRLLFSSHRKCVNCLKSSVFLQKVPFNWFNCCVVLVLEGLIIFEVKFKQRIQILCPFIKSLSLFVFRFQSTTPGYQKQSLRVLQKAHSGEPDQ